MSQNSTKDVLRLLICKQLRDIIGLVIDLLTINRTPRREILPACLLPVQIDSIIPQRGDIEPCSGHAAVRLLFKQAAQHGRRLVHPGRQQKAR